MKKPNDRNKYRASVIALSGVAYTIDGQPVDLTGVRVDIDIYRILEGYEIKNPQMQHVLKKVLCAGQRAGGKDLLQDYDDIINSTQSAIEMERQLMTLNAPVSNYDSMIDRQLEQLNAPASIPDSLIERTELVLNSHKPI